MLFFRNEKISSMEKLNLIYALCKSRSLIECKTAFFFSYNRASKKRLRFHGKMKKEEKKCEKWKAIIRFERSERELVINNFHNFAIADINVWYVLMAKAKIHVSY